MKSGKENKKISAGRRTVLLFDSLFNNILLLLAALVFLFGFYALWDSNQIYSDASSKEYEVYKPQTNTEDPLAAFEGFSQLRSINPEVFGWINIYGTNIDYPLVQADNNEKYINTDSKGNYASTGAIFLDYRSSPNFDDFNTIIYGHHVENGVMFGDLAKFTDKTFFDEHKYGSIYYNGNEKGLEILAVLEVDAYDFDIYNPGISGESERMAYYQALIAKAIYKRDITVTAADQIVLLSTCFLDVTNGRHIVVAKMTDDVPVNDLDVEKAEPFPYNLFGDSALGRLLEKIPLWVWYIIIMILILLIIILLIILFLVLKRKREEAKEDELV